MQDESQTSQLFSTFLADCTLLWVSEGLSNGLYRFTTCSPASARTSGRVDNDIRNLWLKIRNKRGKNREQRVPIWSIEEAARAKMDVDNDIDQNLLQQFSCLGTTDKDDLVKQLQRLLAGSHLNEATATFFLDMNNWNLQAAICSYFDFESPFKLPSMALLCDCTIGEGESVPPNTNFLKSWRIQNTGTEPWPEGVCLQHTDGPQMGDCTRVPVPCLKPKTFLAVSVELTSPAEPGVYQSKWRMATSTGSYFGDVIWVIITVSEDGTLAVTQQLHQLSTSQENDIQMC